MLTKFFRRFLKILFGLLVILIITVIAIAYFVDPNQFKSTIEQTALKQTGQVLTIQGPIVWKWSPLLSLQLENVTLNNPPPFTQPMFSAKAIRIECASWPLLIGKVFLNLTVKELDLHLERNKKEQANWDNLKHKFLTKQDDLRTTTKDSTSSRILLNGINIENGQITLHDDIANKHYKLSQVNLTADKILRGMLGMSNPVSLSFQIADLNSSPVKALGVFTGNVSIKLNSDQLDLQKLVFKFESPNKKIALLSGEAKIQNFNQEPNISGNLETQNLNLQEWLRDFHIAESADLPTALDIQLAFHYQEKKLSIDSFKINSKPQGILEGNVIINRFEEPLNLKGNIQGKELQFGNFKIDTLKAAINAQDNVINVNPINYQIIKTSQKATLQIDLRAKTPKYTLTQTGERFEMSDLLSLFGIQHKLNGKAQININLTTTGNGVNEWKRNLSGQAYFDMSQGKFQGMDFIQLLKNTQSSVATVIRGITQKLTTNLNGIINTEMTKWQNVPSATAFTPFDSAKASWQINNGIAKNSDLAITHANYAIQGNGTLNLANNTVQYRLSLLLKQNVKTSPDPIDDFLRRTPLLVSIQGNLSDPAIRPDIPAYTNMALQFAQKQVLQQVINKNLDKTLNKALDQFIPLP